MLINSYSHNNDMCLITGTIQCTCVCIIKCFPITLVSLIDVEMWRLLGARTGQVLEDFDVNLCLELYEDWRTTSNPSPSRSDNVI